MPVAETITCAVCERTLLMGERPTRYSPHGDEDFVDVCALCQDVALDHGWIKEGAPTTPSLKAERRRRGLLAAVFQPFRPPAGRRAGAPPRGVRAGVLPPVPPAGGGAGAGGADPATALVGRAGDRGG